MKSRDYNLVSTDENWLWHDGLYNFYDDVIMVDTYNNFQCRLLWLHRHIKAAIDYIPCYIPSLRIFMTRPPIPRTNESFIINDPALIASYYIISIQLYHSTMTLDPHHYVCAVLFR